MADLSMKGNLAKPIVRQLLGRIALFLLYVGEQGVFNAKYTQVPIPAKAGMPSMPDFVPRPVRVVPPRFPEHQETVGPKT